MDETALEMARRHVREGTARIDRQRTLNAQLAKDGHQRMAADGERLLATLEATLAIMMEHLAEEERRRDLRKDVPKLSQFRIALPTSNIATGFSKHGTSA